jgi:hypothetical protein
MTEIRNKELREIEEQMRSEAVIRTENTLQTGYIVKVCEELDILFTAFEKRGIFELSRDNNLDNDADIIIQEEFENKILQNDEECLQDLVSEYLYPLLQDIRDIAREFQENLIEENN